MTDQEKLRRYWFTPCGLDCSKCTIHLRTEEELNHWRGKNVDLDKIRCDGCRSDRNEHHWSPDCKILQCCIYERRFEFCTQCPDFPCKIIEEWGKEGEHHAKAAKNLAKMKETGIDKWLTEHSDSHK